jgi:short-subunit dehydrogenase
MKKSKTWLISGVSGGFGACLVEAVIKSGDFVIGTLRQEEQVKNFNQKYEGKAQGILLDVTDEKQISSVIKEISTEEKTIDVLVNNAGYGLFGAIEETSNKEIRQQMETNFFGALTLTKAILPMMRQKRSGNIIQISSIAGFASTAGLGIYNASKYALEGFSEALALETQHLGIKILIVEPGPFRTNWAGSSSFVAENQIADYQETAHKTYNYIKGYSGNQPGDPRKAAELIIETINSANPPLRLPLGKIAVERMLTKIENLKSEVENWKAKTTATDFS